MRNQCFYIESQIDVYNTRAKLWSRIVDAVGNLCSECEVRGRLAYAWQLIDDELDWFLVRCFGRFMVGSLAVLKYQEQKLQTPAKPGEWWRS